MTSADRSGGPAVAPAREALLYERESDGGVTTLVILEHNDSDAEPVRPCGLARLRRPGMPWHVSAFAPAYRMSHVAPTPAATLHRAARIGRDARLRYVYTGNIPDDPWEDTACPSCGRWLLRRRSFEVLDNALEDGRCPVCRLTIAGVWT